MGGRENVSLEKVPISLIEALNLILMYDDPYTLRPHMICTYSTNWTDVWPQSTRGHVPVCISFKRNSIHKIKTSPKKAIRPCAEEG